MWQALGICVLVWLGIGLIVGLKAVFIDNFLDEMYGKIDSGEVEVNEDLVDMYEAVRGNKLFFLVVFTLLGVIGFYGDTRRTFKKRDKK